MRIKFIAWDVNRAKPIGTAHLKRVASEIADAAELLLGTPVVVIPA